MNKKTFNSYFKDFNFKELFNEMGWDNFKDRPAKITVDNIVYTIEGIVQKRDFVIAQCMTDKIPDNKTRKAVENKFSNLYYEHLLVFYDKEHTKQVWQFSVKEENKPKTIKEFQWYVKQDTEALFQRFRNLLFKIDDEENITLLDVIARVNDNFAKNTDKVTKKFYDEFKKYHTRFLTFIENIDDALEDKENKNKQWYASVMLNRLMFCYFIQKKGFLDSDIHYLQHKLEETKQKAGKNSFYSFYKDFLLALFHEGLGKPKVSRTTKIELGNIPYLNGGLFQVHQLEEEFKDIQIKDEFFGLLFDFFDDWNWHLDHREESSGKDINPDVVGYIFEKYINDRAAMGAYYTKEDITEYISKNTIIPFIFDEVKRNYAKPFGSGGEFSELLKHSMNDYIYDAVKKGIKELSPDGIIPDSIEGLNIPNDIKEGLDTTKPGLLERRKDWNTKTPQEYALPTEIWRESIDRWKRYFDIRQKLNNGGIKEINDLITFNLNIRQFAQDLLSVTDDPKLISEVYKALTKITVLDPTCGSGAFLFAALNILEPMYEICIDRMRDFMLSKNEYSYEFSNVIREVDSRIHPNIRYFIFKSIILNNLYGVDIMREAVEIAKLRLFLKLVAEVEPDTRKPNYGLEPLPDIDFNIRTGNTLVGFANEKEIYESIEKHDPLFAEEKIKSIEKECGLVSESFKKYQTSQLSDDETGKNIRKAKNELREKLDSLNHQLNKYLAGTYGIWEEEYGKDKKKYNKDYQQWLQSHQPFHWFSEFYEIIKANGGFDVIIGNPPYVEYSKVRKEYTIKNYETESCGNLYAFVMEKSHHILHNNSKLSMIIPLASFSTNRMSELQDIFINNGINLYISNYEATSNPSTLFIGVKIQLSIIIWEKQENKESETYTTAYNRSYSDERAFLFDRLKYEVSYILNGYITRIQYPIEKEILDVLFKQATLDNYVGQGPRLFYRNMGNFFFKLAFEDEPVYYKNNLIQSSSTVSYLNVVNEDEKYIFIAIINSTLFYYYWILFTDCYHLSKKDIYQFPFEISSLNNSKLKNIVEITKKYIKAREIEAVWQIENKKDGTTKKYRRYFPQKCKPLSDIIDKVLAEHYGFTEEELDFIINYDIKYRMGDELEEEGDE